jgi:hypothetical protein
MHSPVHAVWQHAPCAQIPLAQSDPAPQDAPSGCFPQLFAVQTFPPEQSAPVVQVVRQLVAPQAYGAQLWLAPGAQVPAPSQRAPSVTVEPLQVWIRTSCRWRTGGTPPSPLQTPSVPQLA